MSVPSTGKPAFVMHGIDRPGGGVRLYASRSLKDTVFGHDENPRGKTALWEISSKLDQMLVIDKPTWGEAFAMLFEIWANQDAADQAAIRAAGARRVLAHQRELEQGEGHGA